MGYFRVRKLGRVFLPDTLLSLIPAYALLVSSLSDIRELYSPLQHSNAKIDPVNEDEILFNRINALYTYIGEKILSVDEFQRRRN